MTLEYNKPSPFGQQRYMVRRRRVCSPGRREGMENHQRRANRETDSRSNRRNREFRREPQESSSFGQNFSISHQEQGINREFPVCGAITGCSRDTVSRPRYNQWSAPLAQLDRAADFESVGREFESLRARQFLKRFLFNHFKSLHFEICRLLVTKGEPRLAPTRSSPLLTQSGS
jgi:hypothetical protein